MKAVTFAETKPLPSYLVAFAVGPFDDGRRRQDASGRADPDRRARTAAPPMPRIRRRSTRRAARSARGVLRHAVPVPEARHASRCPSSTPARWRTRASSRTASSADLDQARGAARSAASRPTRSRRARDGAPVVRRLRDARVVGRHLAQRVVRDAGWRPRSSTDVEAGRGTLDVDAVARQVGA